jgi:hypothetical protein
MRKVSASPIHGILRLQNMFNKSRLTLQSIQQTSIVSCNSSAIHMYESFGKLSESSNLRNILNCFQSFFNKSRFQLVTKMQLIFFLQQVIQELRIDKTKILIIISNCFVIYISVLMNWKG